MKCQPTFSRQGPGNEDGEQIFTRKARDRTVPCFGMQPDNWLKPDETEYFDMASNFLRLFSETSLVLNILWTILCFCYLVSTLKSTKLLNLWRSCG